MPNKRRNEDPKKIENLLETQKIWQHKLDTNLLALDERCDAAAEEIQQLKREGKWFCEEE